MQVKSIATPSDGGICIEACKPPFIMRRLYHHLFITILGFSLLSFQFSKFIVCPISYGSSISWTHSYLIHSPNFFLSLMFH
jgi:hypothetical protein